MNKLHVCPNNNLSNGSVKSFFSPYGSNEANLCNGYNGDNGSLYFNYRGALVPIKRYIFSDGQGNGIFTSDQLVKKDDLGVFITKSASKSAVYNSQVDVVSLNLTAGHTYLILGRTDVNANVSLISAKISVPSSEYGSFFNFMDTRTAGTSGGGCMTAAIGSVTKDCTVTLQGYGYENKTYDYRGYLIAAQLK